MESNSSLIWEKYVFGEHDLRMPLNNLTKFRRKLLRYQLNFEFTLSRLLKEDTSSIPQNEVSEILHSMTLDPRVKLIDVLEAVFIFHANPWYISPSNNQSVLHNLISGEKYKIAEIIIRTFHKSHPNLASFSGQKLVTDQLNRTLLTAACTKKSTLDQRRLVSILVKSSQESINLKDCFGNSALYYAWVNKNTFIVRKLLRNGAAVIETINCYSRLIDYVLKVSGKLSPAISFNQPQMYYQTLLQGLIECHEKNLLVDYEYGIRYSLPVVLNKDKVLDGMLMFKLLLEIKSMKRKENAFGTINYTDSENHDLTKENFENDLMRREEIQLRHRKNKLFHHNLAIQRRKASELNYTQSQIKERIDKEFNESLAAVSRNKVR